MLTMEHKTPTLQDKRKKHAQSVKMESEMMDTSLCNKNISKGNRDVSGEQSIQKQGR